MGGDVADGDTVTLTVNDVEYTGTVSSGAFSIDVPGAALTSDTDLTIDASVTTTDAAGNSTTATDTETYTVDTTAPIITIDVIAGDDVVDDTEDNSVTVSGTTTGVEDNQTVTVTINGQDYTTTVLSNSWSIIGIDLSSLNDEETYDVIANVSDAAGNAAPEVTRQITTLDSSGPSVNPNEGEIDLSDPSANNDDDDDGNDDDDDSDDSAFETITVLGNLNYQDGGDGPASTAVIFNTSASGALVNPPSVFWYSDDGSSDAIEWKLESLNDETVLVGVINNDGDEQAVVRVELIDSDDADTVIDQYQVTVLRAGYLDQQPSSSQGSTQINLAILAQDSDGSQSPGELTLTFLDPTDIIGNDVVVLEGSGENKDGRRDDDELAIELTDDDAELSLDINDLPTLYWTSPEGTTYQIHWDTEKADTKRPRVFGYVDLNDDGDRDGDELLIKIVLQVRESADDDDDIDSDYKVPWKAVIKNNDGVFHLDENDTTAVDLAISFTAIAESGGISDTGVITVGIDQTGDSKVTIDGQAIDGAIIGMRYETSSGLSGTTGANGAFTFDLEDKVSFYVGAVFVGSVEAAATEIIGKIFLQDIAGVGLENITNDYVENLAIFLQTLDEDGDPYNGIQITEEMHELFADDAIDLASLTKEELVQLLVDKGLEPVDEASAMQHVMDMLRQHADQTEFQEDDNDAVMLLEPVAEDELSWTLADEYESDQASLFDQTPEDPEQALHIGDLFSDVEDADLSQYVSVTSDGSDTVISVDPNGLSGGPSETLQTRIVEGVDLTVDAEGNALDADSMNELLRTLLQTNIDSLGSMH